MNENNWITRRNRINERKQERMSMNEWDYQWRIRMNGIKYINVETEWI